MSNKILIIDDEAHIRLLLQQTLEDFEDEGVQIITADNGKDGYELIKSEEPDLVFLDVMMPHMNGYEVCESVKRDHDLKKTVIVLLTAKGQEADKKKGDEAGADAYMTKPFDPDLVVAKASEVLRIEI